ncbi:OmpA family protein [Pseudomonas sp. zfem002]|uniref:OmpA family protein n=1 Tax=Pseudomonas sp. zfem002 TaxID=3078197 RepID=UPI002928B393|nr:OmpA family protein [Pseudomonas sp. zfem002]MDU9393627.1 OmpA family protein [Pseudomonas sp. zfem002]
MTLKLTRGLWLWGAALALGLLLIVPLDDGWRMCAAVLVTALLAWGWRRAGREAGQLREALQLADGALLPPASYRQPVVLVCGSGLEVLFDGACDERPRLRMSVQGCYISVAEARQLPTLVAALLARRPGWAGQLSVLFVASPGHCRDSMQLDEQARAIAHQLQQLRRRGHALPLLLASYLRAAQGQGPWFIWRGAQASAEVHEAGAATLLHDWQRQAGNGACGEARLHTSVRLGATADWLHEQVLGHFAALAPVACGVSFVASLPGECAGHLWQQWLRRKLALVDTREIEAGESTLLELPDPLLAQLSLRLRATPRQRASIRALWLFAGAGLLALASSAWNNQRLMSQVAADLQRYASIPPPSRAEQPAHALREEAVAVLRQHAALLEHYHRNGEPLALGFGLYRDEVPRARLLEVLMMHRTPVTPPPPLKTPQIVRLSSLSLFASGSAELRPESTKVLVNALVDIKAQPGWLIVIAGHTDATGSDPHNLRLSQARAAAVRDWMQRMGDIPDSCFAVQGFGASQPIASNDHDDGRMSNRRVDIRLVPAEGACAPAASVSG